MHGNWKEIVNNLIDWETGLAKTAKPLALSVEHKYVTTGVIFLALIAEGEGAARDAIVQQFRLTPEKVQLALQATKPKWPRRAKESKLFTQGVLNTFEQAMTIEADVGITDELLEALLTKGYDADLKRLFVNLELSGDALREVLQPQE